MYGWDAAKKVKGRKRHILVDSLGMILSSIVLSADVQDRKGAEFILFSKEYFLSKLQKIYADGAYAGKEFIENIYNKTKWKIVPVKRNELHIF